MHWMSICVIMRFFDVTRHMYTDSHCHLNRLDLDALKMTQNEALAHIRNQGVDRLMTIMCHFDETDALREWLKACAQAGIEAGMSIGVHPCERLEVLQAVTLSALMKMGQEDNVWALGESGLDYMRISELNTSQQDALKRAQASSFVNHIEAANALQKPLVVHTRDAYEDTLGALKEAGAKHGIIHCFTEDWAFARSALDMGFYLSFSGIVSFKSAQNIALVAKQAPRDRVLIETDSPYLAPVPKRGKTNTPAYIPYVANALGALWDMSPEQVGAITSDNFTRARQGL